MGECLPKNFPCPHETAPPTPPPKTDCQTIRKQGDCEAKSTAGCHWCPTTEKGKMGECLPKNFPCPHETAPPMPPPKMDCQTIRKQGDCEAKSTEGCHWCPIKNIHGMGACLPKVRPCPHATPLQDDGLPRGVRFENQTWVQEQLKKNAMHMADFEKNGDSNGCTMSGPLPMPTCLQICNEWCWAAVTSMTIDYYKNQSQCQGLECQIPSKEFGLQCCPYDTNSCHNKQSDPQTSCNKGGRVQQMADAAGAFAGGPFSVYGSLNQTTLDNALNSGRPVMMTVLWGALSGHALMIGGCGQGKYYLHDPWGWYSRMPPKWQSLTYDQLLRYTSPRGDVGVWISSVMWSLSDEAGHQMAVQRTAVANRTSEFMV